MYEFFKLLITGNNNKTTLFCNMNLYIALFFSNPETFMWNKEMMK